MNNLQEINKESLNSISGGCSFAYDVGYFLRQAGTFLSLGGGNAAALSQMEVNALCYEYACD